MSTPSLPTSRRTALALALSAPLALASCDLDPPSAAPSESPSTAAPLPDTQVVASARKAILVTVALIDAVHARHGFRRVDHRPLLSMHAAHLEVLDDGSQDETVEGAIPENTPALARKQVAAAENVLASSLVRAATQASSGDLARALASMSAAVAQRVVA